MSDRVERLSKQSFSKHREAISKEMHIRGSQQDCLDVLSEAITNLNATVIKLLDIEVMKRQLKYARGSDAWKEADREKGPRKRKLSTTRCECGHAKTQHPGGQCDYAGHSCNCTGYRQARD